MLIEANVKQLKQYLLPALYTIFILGFFFFPSSKSLSNFFYLFVAFPLVILIFMQKVDLRPLFSSRTFLLITVYLVYMFCTLFWADSFSMSDLSKYGRRVLYILIFLSVTIHLTQSYPTFTQRLLVVLCWAAAIVAITTVLFFYRQRPFTNRLLGYGLLYSPTKASSQYGMVVIACTYLLLHQRSVGMQLLYLGLLFVGFSYMLLAQSRSSLLSLAVAMIVWQLFAWLPHKGDKDNRRYKLLVVLVLIFAVSAGLFMIHPQVFKSSLIGRGYSSRLEIWGQLLVRIKDAPWLGHGLNAYAHTVMSNGTIIIHPHSVYVGTLLYGGIIGLLLLTAVVVSALWQGFGSAGNPINLATAIMFLYGALFMVPHGNMLIHHVKPFWLLFWFPVALVVTSELPGHPLHSEFERSEDGSRGLRV
jgi:O-antigen ligase